MTTKSHSEGFEREAMYHDILGELITEFPQSRVKARMISVVASHLAPEFLDGLFEMRRCERRLRFVGCDCNNPDSCNHNLDPFFIKDQIYQSIAFSGAQYVIDGWKDGRGSIGSEYFERVD